MEPSDDGDKSRKRDNDQDDRLIKTCDQRLIAAGNWLADASGMAGDISSDLVTAGLITAGAGFVTGRPEVIGIGGVVTEMGGAIGMTAGGMQVASGLLQGFGGGDCDVRGKLSR
jgi:hypothetical protein